VDVIVVEGISKSYRVGVGRARVREMLPAPLDRVTQRLFPRWWTRNTFNALDGVTVSMVRGSSVGLVGHNGAGKTTLLRVIAGVTSPTEGTVRVSGRLAALIDALVGFHPDLTGRENMYLLGAMHGFGRRAMAPRIDRILEFAEIDDLADTPLKRFSAGMAARLGFATVTALDPEILLVDEVLAVGDASFQRKCIDWLDEYRGGGGTLLFVSHNLSLIRNMTERVVWMDHGRVAGDGPTRSVLADYGKAMERRETDQPQRRKEAKRVMASQGLRRWGAGGARVEEAHIAQSSEHHGDEVEVAISYTATQFGDVVFCVGFVDEAGHEIGATASEPISLNGGEGALRCVIQPVPFRSGIYFPVVAIVGLDGIVWDRWKLDRAVVVERNGDSLADFGPVAISAGWSVGPTGGPRDRR
jgi:ABC-type polysaccharide/polyol phosphate transport system ATPase subunit